MTKLKLEIAIGSIVLIFSFLFFGYIDVLEKLVEWSRSYERYELDEILSTLIVLVILLLIFSVRRLRESVSLSKKLQQALNEIIKGIVPICSYCKKARDEDGDWHKIGPYMHSHPIVEFSKGICPVCKEKEERKG